MPDFLGNRYIQIVIIIIIFLIAKRILFKIIEFIFKNWAKKTQIDDKILKLRKIKTPLLLLAITLIFKIIIVKFKLSTPVLQNIISSIIIASVFWLIIIIFSSIIIFWQSWFEKKHQPRLGQTIFPLFQKIVSTILFLIAAVWILKRWNYDIGPLLAGLGLIGFVVGMALKDTLSSIIAGIFMILDGTLAIGDKIKLFSPPQEGVISEIGLRKTKIKTLENQVLLVPNSVLAKATIIKLDNKEQN